MNAHVIAEAIEQPFRFEIGQAVEHRGGGLQSVILDRQRTLFGTELYELHIASADAHGRPLRTMRGDFLVHRVE